MCRKIIICTIASVLILGISGYCGFWLTQSKKLETLVVESIKSGNENFRLNGTHIKYDKISKTGFPYNVGVKIKNLHIETTTKVPNTTNQITPDDKTPETIITNPDLNNMNNTDLPKNRIVTEENLRNTDMVETITKILVEDSEIMSNITLTHFAFKNLSNIKMEDEKNELTNIDFKPVLEVDFFESPLKLPILANTNSKFKNIKEVDFESTGYKIYDKAGNTLQESNAKNTIKIRHKVDDGKDNLHVKINLDNHAKLNNLSEDKPKTSQMLAMEKALYSVLNLEFTMFDLNDFEKNDKFKIDIKHLDWDMDNTKLHSDGSLHFKKGDYVPYGLVNIIINNNREFFNTICGISNDPSGNTDCNFLRKIVPEIANENLNANENDIKVIYNREEGKPTMIGKKNLEEFLSEYYSFMKNYNQ